MVIRTEPYGARDTVEILKVKAAAEGVALADEALAALAKAAVASSLRYALQLIAPASILAEAAGEAVVGAAHVAEAKELFWDCLRSARRLGEGESHFLG